MDVLEFKASSSLSGSFHCTTVNEVPVRIILEKCCQNRVAGFHVTLWTWAKTGEEELFLLPSVHVIEPHPTQQSFFLV